MGKENFEENLKLNIYGRVQSKRLHTKIAKKIAKPEPGEKKEEKMERGGNAGHWRQTNI